MEPDDFLSDWVNERLFRVEQLEILVPPPPAKPVIYRDEKCSLTLQEGRLTFCARHPTAEALRRAEQLAIDAIEALPHTPITAIGVNFAYRQASPARDILELFNLSDDDALGEGGWRIRSRKLLRTLAGEDGRILNLTLDYGNEDVVIDANFHFPVTDATGAAQSLRGNVEPLRGKIEELVRLAHGLESEGAYS